MSLVATHPICHYIHTEDMQFQKQIPISVNAVQFNDFGTQFKFDANSVNLKSFLD